VDLHKLASLLVRDYTIVAKRHYDLARDYRAIAATWRQALALPCSDVLGSTNPGKDSMVAAPPLNQEESAYQESFEAMD
jgi:hypothetical protein